MLFILFKLCVIPSPEIDGNRWDSQKEYLKTTLLMEYVQTYAQAEGNQQGRSTVRLASMRNHYLPISERVKRRKSCQNTTRTRAIGSVPARICGIM